MVALETCEAKILNFVFKKSVIICIVLKFGYVTTEIDAGLAHIEMGLFAFVSRSSCICRYIRVMRPHALVPLHGHINVVFVSFNP